MLITSLAVVTSIVLAYAIIRLISGLLNIQIRNNIKIHLITFSLALFVYQIHYITDKSISIVLYFFALMICTKFIFKIDFIKAAFVSLISYLILIVTDIISLTIFMILNLKPLMFNLNEQIIYGNLIVTIIILIILNINCLMQLLSKTLTRLENKLVKTVLSSVIIIALLYTFIYYNISQKSIETILINILTIVMFTIILIKLYIEQINKNNIKNEYEKMSDYVKVYEEIIEKDRIQRHENKNQLITIKGMLSKTDKKTKEYLDSLISDNTDKSFKWVSELKNIPIGGLKGLIFYKVSKMRELGIEANLTISRSLENSKLQDIDVNTYKQLCQIMGVYLDNAIEACTESDVKNIGIEIYKDKDIFEFIIENTYKGNLNIDNIDTAGYTTKGNGHGYGLSLVKDIIKSNPKFFQNREMINEYYTQHLFLDLTE